MPKIIEFVFIYAAERLRSAANYSSPLPLLSRPSAREGLGLARPEIKQSSRLARLITVFEREAATLKLTEQAPAA
ncbi:MAG TPA: hypothetical protein VGM44_16990 [Polyangiaceae bacterium]|jgi:hypothetical protein